METRSRGVKTRSANPYLHSGLGTTAKGGKGAPRRPGRSHPVVAAGAIKAVGAGEARPTPKLWHIERLKALHRGECPFSPPKGEVSEYGVAPLKQGSGLS
jgi:hypothetical protein